VTVSKQRHDADRPQQVPHSLVTTSHVSSYSPCHRASQNDRNRLSKIQNMKSGY